MDLRKAFGTDRKAEEEGVWINLGDGARIKVARSSNKRYRELIRRLLKPHRAAMRSDNLPDETMEAIVIEATAEALLLDWQGIEFDGALLPYSVENAKKVLAALPDFRDAVATYAGEMATFRAQAEQAELGN